MSSSAEAPPVDPARFRQVLGHFPTGVTVVASTVDGEPYGVAIGSFFSVSLDPALVGFCVGTTSSTWPKIKEAGTFCVNILGAHQEEICRVFASKEPDKFRSVGWKPTALGSPLIADSLGWIDCTIEAIHDGGDHDIVIGRVHDLDVGHEGGPLIFFRGGYANLA